MTNFNAGLVASAFVGAVALSATRVATVQAQQGAVQPQTVQLASVTGTVTAEEGHRPLEGASVQVMGARGHTLTDVEGHFLLSEIPDGEITLLVEYDGFVSLTEVLELTPGEMVLVNFRLSSVAAALEALIVQAGGDGVRKDQGFADGTLDVSDDASSLTAADLLVGSVPGLSTTMGSSMVGGGTGVRIRGVTTISLSGAPAVYVDDVLVGSPTSEFRGGSQVLQVLQEIPASSVRRIRVLRGAAATANYPFAKSGVILVETRR